jgi:HEAT repeat protein
MPELRQIQQQVEALRKTSETARRNAIHALRQYKEGDFDPLPNSVVNSAVDSLLKCAVNCTSQPIIRHEIAIVLGNIGPRAKAAVPHLIEWLTDAYPNPVREASAGALGKMGREARGAVAGLIQVLGSGRSALILQAVRALGSIGCADQRVKAALTDCWLQPLPSQQLQVQVGIALCKLGIDAKGLKRSLANALIVNQEASIRKAACEALSWCGENDSDVVPALLLAALNDKNEDVRHSADAALAHMGVKREKAIGICAKQLAESVYAETALRKSGPTAVPALMKALDREDPIVREKATRILGCLGESASQAIPALTKALKARDNNIRLAAAKGLWSIGKQAELVVPVLVKLLDEEPYSAVEAADARRNYLQTVIEALWRIGPAATAAIPRLQVKARDKNRLVKESALSALKAISPTLEVKAR